MTRTKGNIQAVPSREPGKVFGFVLILRGLGRAAIRLHDRPAALRVLVLVCEYMNNEGECRVSHGTIASRLGISRQAVQKHVDVLAERGLLLNSGNPQPGDRSLRAQFQEQNRGKTLRYFLNTDGLEAEREGEGEVEAYRHRRREEKRDARQGVAPSPRTKTQLDEDEEDARYAAEMKAKTEERAAQRQAEGVALTSERFGYPAYCKVLPFDKQCDATDADRLKARAAMERYEAEHGYEYQFAGEQAYVAHWRLVRSPAGNGAGDMQPLRLHQMQPNEVARGAA